MISSATSSINSFAYDQLSSTLAKRSAEQAAQKADALREQADTAQALADQYDAKARSLDNQANKAEVNSDEARLRLTLSGAFKNAGQQLVQTVNQAVVKPDVYAASESALVSQQQTIIGGTIDTTA